MGFCPWVGGNIVEKWDSMKEKTTDDEQQQEKLKSVEKHITPVERKTMQRMKRLMKNKSIKCKWCSMGCTDESIRFCNANCSMRAISSERSRHRSGHQSNCKLFAHWTFEYLQPHYPNHSPNVEIPGFRIENTSAASNQHFSIGRDFGKEIFTGFSFRYP